MYSSRTIAPAIHQLHYFDAPRGIGFNQYLVAADAPALVSAGSVAAFDALWQELDGIIPAASLRYLVVPHFEADEAGAVASFLARCPAARPVCAAVAARQLVGFGLCSNPLVVGEGDVVDLGSHQLRCVLVPWEMHLWDGLVVQEEQTGVLFSSDLFGQRLDPAGERPGTLGAAAAPMTQGAVPVAALRQDVYRRLAALAPRVVAPGHGFAFTLDAGFDAAAAEVEAVAVGA